MPWNEPVMDETGTGDADMGIGLDPYNRYNPRPYQSQITPGNPEQNRAIAEYARQQRENREGPLDGLRHLRLPPFDPTHLLGPITQPTDRGQRAREYPGEFMREYDIPVLSGIANISEKTMGRIELGSGASDPLGFLNAAPFGAAKIVRPFLGAGSKAAVAAFAVEAAANITNAADVVGPAAGTVARGVGEAAARGMQEAFGSGSSLVPRGYQGAAGMPSAKPLGGGADDAARAAQELGGEVGAPLGKGADDALPPDGGPVGEPANTSLASDLFPGPMTFEQDALALRPSWLRGEWVPIKIRNWLEKNEQSISGNPPRAPDGGPVGDDAAEELERGLSGRMRTEPGLIDEASQRVLDDNILTYERLGNQAAHDMAASRILADPAAARARVMDVTAEADPIAIAEGLQLMEQARRSGSRDEWLSLVAALAVKGTARGQEIQLFSTLVRMSPDTIMLAAARTLKKAEAKGKGATPKALAAADARILDEQVNAAVKAELAKANAEIAILKKERAALVHEPVDVPDLLKEFSGGDRGAVPIKGSKVSYEDAEVFQGRWVEIQAMPEGAERTSAHRKLLSDVENAGVKASAPKAKPHGGKLQDASELPDNAKGAAQREKDKLYLTDDTVRDVEPRIITASREAISKVKAIYKQMGVEMTDEQADDFLELASDVDRTGIRDLVEQQRALLGKGKTAPPFSPTPKWLAKQVVEIEKLTDPKARQQFSRLHSIERLAMARIMSALRRTGIGLPEEMAEEVVIGARQLRDLRSQPPEVQAMALNQFVENIKKQEPLATALTERAAQMDADRAARTAARKVAAVIEQLTTKHTPRKPPVQASSKKALSSVVSIFRRADVQLTTEEADAVLAAVKAIDDAPAEQQKMLIADLVGQTKQFDPVARRLKEQADEVEADKLLKRKIADIDMLTGKIAAEAPTRADNVRATLIGNAKRARSENGLDLPPTLANAMWESAQAIGAMAPGLQQSRKYEGFMRDVKNLLPPSKWAVALDIWGIPKAIRSSWDAGYMLRQGTLLGFRHPGEWMKTWEPMLKSMRSLEFAEQTMDQMATRPLANVAHESGVMFDEIYEGSEFFGTSQVVKKYPGVAGSQAGHVVGSNMLRNHSYDAVVMDWLPKGYDIRANPINTLAEAAAVTGKTEQQFRDLALLTNAASGRSNVKWLQGNLGRVMNFTFWAPGWAMSIPEVAVRTVGSPGARKEGARILAGYFGFVAGVETLGDQAGIWDAELDPRSSNFGKVRWKGTQTYTDPTLGLGIMFRTVAQMVPTPGEKGWHSYRKDARGDLVIQAWDEPLKRFLRNKASPSAGELMNWIDGQTAVGESRRGTDLESWAKVGLETVKALALPLTPAEIAEGIAEYGLEGGVVALPNLVGVGQQTFKTFGDRQNEVAKTMFQRDYRELDAGNQRIVNDSPQIQVEVAKFEAKAVVNKQDEVSVRYKVYEEGKDALEQGRPATATSMEKLGLRDYIDAGMTGEALRKKIQEFKGDSYTLASNLLTDDVRAASTQRKDIPLHDLYAQQWLNVPLEENPQTGDMNFKKQNDERARILLAAQDALKAAGRGSDYITGKGENSYRRQSIKDPVVREVVERYEKAQETLRPYRELKDKVQERTPVFATLQQTYDALSQDMSDVGKYKLRLYTQNERWQLYQRTLDMHQESLRLKQPDVDKALVEWGYSSTPIRIQRALRNR